MTLKRIKSWDWKSSPPACIILLVTSDGPGDPSGLSFLISDSSSLAEIGSVKMEGVEWEVEEAAVLTLGWFDSVRRASCSSYGEFGCSKRWCPRAHLK